MNIRQRPVNLSSDYTLEGPKALHITGDISDAKKIEEVDTVIRDAAGPTSEWWPSVSNVFHFVNMPHASRSEVKRVKNDHPSELVQGLDPFAKQLLVVSGHDVSREVAFLLGSAVESPSIERTMFLGRPEYLGALASNDEIQVIDEPLNVFRWVHPEGPFQPVTAEAIK